MSRMRAASRQSHRQHGAVAVWVGLSMVALLMATFLAIDVGRLYYSQRELQKVASLASTAAARIASGCSAGDGFRVGVSGVQSTVESVVLANGGAVSWLTGVNGTPAIEVGKTETRQSDGVRVFVALNEGDPEIDSVRVNLTRPTPASFIPAFMPGSAASLKASASARQAVVGSIGVGSGLLSLDTDNITFLNTILPPLLNATGISLNLNALDYEGLARTNISVDMLATAVGVDAQDLSALLNTSTTLPGVLNGLSPLVNQAIVGGTSATVTGLLQQLGAAASGNTTPFPLVNVLGNTVQAVGSAVPAINLLDLVMALAMAANADPEGNVQPIRLPIGVSLLGIDLATYLKILEPPQVSSLLAPGTASASTAQIRLLLRLQVTTVSDIVAGLNSLLSLINALLGPLLSVGTFQVDPIKLAIDLYVAPATAYIDEISCPMAGVNDGLPVAKTSVTTGVASVQVGSFNGNIGSAQSTTIADTAPITGVRLGPVTLLPILGPALSLGTLSLNVNAVKQSPIVVGNPARQNLADVVDFTRMDADELPSGATRAWSADGQPPNPAVAANPQTVGSTGLVESALDSTLHTLVTGITVTADPSSPPGLLTTLSGLLGPLLNLITTSLVNTLEPLLVDTVAALLDSIVDPLLESLGIKIGTATSIMKVVAVDNPEKVGTCLPNAALPRGCLPADQ